MAMFRCVGIVGVGLIGGSLGLALRARGLAQEVVGFGPNPALLERARERGAIDRIGLDTPEHWSQPDCLVFAAPVSVIPAEIKRLARWLPPEVLVTDVGSTKAAICAAGEQKLGARFVGGHPMAGSEVSGIEAARGDLFVGAAWCVVRSAPLTLTDDTHAQKLVALIEALEARPVLLDAAQHDRLVAQVSHLPHALAFALWRTVATDPNGELARTLAGGGFRDMTRIAHSDPALWRDIFLANRTQLLAALDAFQVQLDALRAGIEAGDPIGLENLLSPPPDTKHIA